MLTRIVTPFGPCLTLNAGTTPLTTNFQRGTSIRLQGTEEIDVPIQAAFDGASTATGIDFQLLVSDDNVNFDPIQSTRMDTGATAAFHTLAVALGTTVRTRLQTLDYRDSVYLAVAARLSNATTPKAGDAANAQLNFGMF